MLLAHQILLVFIACSPWIVSPLSVHGTTRTATFSQNKRTAHQRLGHGSFVPFNRDLPSLRSTPSKDSSEEKLREEAQRLLERAKELRAGIPDERNAIEKTPTQAETKTPVSKWAVEASGALGVPYRLYVDIGREEGTWMDPRWGASGKRIEFTLDTRFLTEGDGAFANETVQEKMVKDNFGGKSSPVYVLETATNARLRSGFDVMKCNGGGYRIDTTKNGATVRFYISVDGTPATGSSFGDVSVPKGCLYFSLPCFGNSVSNLSTKEGIVSVRQIGWHTGWRREESRIAGVFRAVPIEKARERDGF